MAGWALGLLAVYLALAFGVRVAVQLRATGSSGIARLAGAPPIELLGGGLFFAGMAMGVASPLLVVLDRLEPIESLDATPAHLAGFALVGVGIVATFVSQLQMGASWRIGVDQSERTELVTSGLFSLVRNPIYTAMAIAWLGLALLVPTWLAIASLPVGLTGIEIQVRLVEEPHLLRAHGEAFGAYSRRVGRFLPGVGRFY